VVRRGVFLQALVAPVLLAQFYGLSSTADASSVYFSSTLRLNNAAPPLASQPLNGKIYVASSAGIQPFAFRDPAPAPANLPPCSAGGFTSYQGTETAANGTIALFYSANTNNSGCSFPINTAATEIRSAAGTLNVPGVARLASAGRYAIVFLANTARPSASVTVSFLDLQTGAQTTVANLMPPAGQFIRVPFGGGRVIADDGTSLIATGDLVGDNGGFLVKPGLAPQLFPVAGGLPVAIDAAASKVVYQKQGISLLDLRTQQSTPLIPSDRVVTGLNLSDDGRRLLYLDGGQLHVLDTTSLADRVLTADAAQITEATLSGDGNTVFAVTGVGRLLRINANDGTQTELVGRTPSLQSFTFLMPGLTTTLTGAGLADSTYYGKPPLTPYLDGVTMWIGERKVPMAQLTPTSVSFIVPWDVSGPIRMLVEARGDHTPFYFPELEASVATLSFPVAGVIARQDWTQTYSGPVNTGEIIHVYAIGFGPVAPEVPEGAAAPSAEPFSRLTRPLTCSNADVLYAGLAPGAVERVYQIDLRIGPVAGYQKFTCALGGDSFVFLTLNVVQ
jgi:uncharacterized protein (TIGR03437 family)